MKNYTVSELAELAGITVRTLHHYDQIGLLKPACVGENRYRYYGEEELLRLQQILIHRELGMPLEEIGSVLDDPGFDRLQSLLKQRERLEAEARRYGRMLKTVDRTIAKLKGERAMKDADLYSGVVSPQKQAEYEAWLVNRHGEGMRAEIEASRAKAQAVTSTEVAAKMLELQEIETALADAMRNGTPPQARALDPLIERHSRWVGAAWDKPCPPAAYGNLADMYEAHPDFVARYETIAKDFGAWLPAAMRSWAQRQNG